MTMISNTTKRALLLLVIGIVVVVVQCEDLSISSSCVNEGEGEKESCNPVSIDVEAGNADEEVAPVIVEGEEEEEEVEEEERSSDNNGGNIDEKEEEDDEENLAEVEDEEDEDDDEENDDDEITKEKEAEPKMDDDSNEQKDYTTFHTIHGPVIIGSHDDDGAPPILECGLYMAESSIPFAGWGMYTAVPLDEGDTVQPTDTCIQVNDQVRYMRALRKSKPTRDSADKKGGIDNSAKDLPDWLMEQYYWNARVAWADYDAKSIDTIIPSFGMLANSHTGLVNLDNLGPKRMEKVTVLEHDSDDNENKKVGAYTTHRDQSFVVLQDLPAGHELFADYGDQWFRERETVFGPIPLSKDYRDADKVLQRLYRICNKTLTTDFCQDLWTLVRDEAIQKAATSDRLMRALPDTMEDVIQILEGGDDNDNDMDDTMAEAMEKRKGSTAYHSLPNVIRTIPWLQENGMCLDHMQPGPSTIETNNAGMGAFARRDLPRGAMLTPAPLIHMHRNHLAVLTTDSQSGEILWQGHQLLLNYCYSHPSSSLIFFPYSPVTNFINHAPAAATESNDTSENAANVGMRWSPQMKHKEWLHLTTAELLEENLSAGLMMELYLLRDVQEGEELFLDYGPAWQEAWDKFQVPETVKRRAEDFVEAHEIKDMKVLPTEYQKKNPLPRNVMPVCWVNEDTMTKTDEEGIFIWSKTSTKYLDATDECSIIKRNAIKDKPTLYDVRYKIDKNEYVIVKDLPRRAITLVDKQYTKHQYLRGTFRHEIHMPDDMMPVKWRDLEEYREECGLYMAESSIPFSGLGMYTAVAIEDQQRIFYGDTVVQIADFKVNRKLRHWHHGTEKNDEPDWLLENYYWQSDNTMGEFDADRVYSIVPGMGMLANSHTGLINSDMRRPTRESGGLHRSTHPQAGASTTYHDVNFIAAYGDIEAGSELFVEYGDNWFEHREKELGVIPLSDDFPKADEMLKEFYDLVGQNVTSDMAKDLWEILWNTSSDEEDNRIRNALPRSLERVPEVIEMGTAKNSVPNRLRSIDWLKDNGICLDNIKPGKSTIRGAHNGAFATRQMKEGQIIAPAPVVHIQREVLEVYDSENIKNKNKPTWYDGEQLLLNYCFGHSNSSVLLYPYAPVVNYINHDHTKFNAKVRWSNLPTQNLKLKEMDAQEVMTHDHAGLIMEFVATRDIARGEEILLDYGDLWEELWQDWISEWSLDTNTNEYTPAFELNDFLQPVRTVTEQKVDPYPKNAKMVCFIHTDKEPLEENKKGEPIYLFRYTSNLYETSGDGYPCDILERNGKKGWNQIKDSVAAPLHTYTVRVFKPKKKVWIVRNLPRRAIHFMDEEYASDLTLSNTFRSAIGLPTHMMPPAWMDYTPVMQDNADFKKEQEQARKEREERRK